MPRHASQLIYKQIPMASRHWNSSEPPCFSVSVVDRLLHRLPVVGIIPLMVANACPLCGKPIAADDINIKEGVGLCRSCGKLSRLADIADQPAVDAKTLATPPEGCSYFQSIGGEVVVRASCRSLGAAVATLAICLFWNGIVSVFVLVAISGLYSHFIGPVPSWFPAPTESGQHGRNATGMPLGTTLFLCVFLIPFVLVGSAMILAFFMCLIGRVETNVTGSDGRVRTGFGPFNWTRRFDASKVSRVSTGQTSYETNGQRKQLIQIDADRTVKFGSGLPDQRRNWMLGILQVLLVGKTRDAQTSAGADAICSAVSAARSSCCRGAHPRRREGHRIWPKFLRKLSKTKWRALLLQRRFRGFGVAGATPSTRAGGHLMPKCDCSEADGGNGHFSLQPATQVI